MLSLMTAALRSCSNLSLSGLGSSWALTNLEGMKSITRKKLDRATMLRVSFIKTCFLRMLLKLICKADGLQHVVPVFVGWQFRHISRDFDGHGPRSAQLFGFEPGLVGQQVVVGLVEKKIPVGVDNILRR